jgi:NAD(P)-dependent dehydrogenase (short-subunit alcohol dehydrogenase family)
MIHIIGGGLAGSEAAWQAVSMGVPVTLHEMRPALPTAVHKTDKLAELVCSNSLRGDKLDNAVGLLKEEMRRLGSLILRVADRVRVPAGAALAADWDSVIDTNLKGPFLCARAIGPGMVKRGWGRVVNLGSILGAVALGGRAPYASSKAGVINLTRVLALEWAGTGVTATSICPGPFATEMNLPLLNDPVKYQEFVKKIPMGRWGELDELAGAVVFLASPSSSFITGASLFVDGGWTAQ